MSNSLNTEKLEDGSERVVLSLPAALAPYKVAIMPLTRKDGLPEKAREIMAQLQLEYSVQYDEKDSIGKRYRRQDAIGGNWEFTPQFSGGLKFLITDNFTFNIEGAFQHISNANTSARNEGVNAYGGFAGFTYYFDDLWLQDGNH